MASAHKKVVLRSQGPAPNLTAGYLPLSGIVRNHHVDLLDTTGHVRSIPLSDIKSIAYVRDFNLADTINPERLTRRTFLARPRTEGLWIRISFADGDLLEGLAPLDLSLLDSIAADRGVYLIPPDTRSNTQRLFIPHAAMADLQILAVITTPSKTSKVLAELQPDLFPPET
jgi:hypothetical protein